MLSLRARTRESVLKPLARSRKKVLRFCSKRANYGVKAAMVFVQPHPAQLIEISRMIAAGKLKPHVETVLQLAEFKRTHEFSKSGRTRGKIVLQP